MKRLTHKKSFAMDKLNRVRLRLIVTSLFWLNGCANDHSSMVHFSNQRLPKTTLIYADPSGVTTYVVAKNRRHVRSYNQDGSLRWKVDPFNDANLRPYRFRYPQISYVGKPQPWQLKGHDRDSVAIQFNSSQFGLINARTGDFTLQGND